MKRILRGRIARASPAALLFWGMGAYLLADPGLQFNMEVQFSGLLAWFGRNPAITLVLILAFVSSGSLADHVLLREGAGNHPVLAVVLSLVVVAALALGFAFYLTGTHITFDHDLFYVTVLVFLTAGLLIWYWAYTRY